MTDISDEKVVAEFDGKQPELRNEPCAFKRACFRAGWEAARIAELEAAQGVVKPLKWNYFEVLGRFGEMGVWDANSILGAFTIEKHGINEFCLVLPNKIIRTPKSDFERVKSDAMDHLKSELKSAFITPPADTVEEAVKAEREACAEIAERYGPNRPLTSFPKKDLIRGRWEGEQAASNGIAIHIRARGEEGK